MVYKGGTLVEPSRQIINARKWGAAIVTAAFGFGFLVSEAQRLRLSLQDPLTFGYLVLFVVVAALIFLWLWATQKELEILLQWLDPEKYVPPSSLKETSMALALAAVLVALLYCARDPLWFGIAFTAYSLAVPLATRYLNSQIGKAINGSRTRLTADLGSPVTRPTALLYSKGVDELERYFLKPAQMLRYWLIAAFALVGTVLAAAWKLQGLKSAGVTAYAVFFLTILVSEFVILRWRQQREAALQPLARELRDLEHDQA